MASPESIHSLDKKKAGGTLAAVPGHAHEGQSVAVVDEGAKGACRDDVSRVYDAQVHDKQALTEADTIEDTKGIGQGACFEGAGVEDRRQGAAGVDAG